MCTTGWTTKTPFTDKLKRRNKAVRRLAGWLLAAAGLTGVFSGCSADLRQAAMPYETQFYKVSETDFGPADTVKEITLPSFLESSLAVIEKNSFIDDSNPSGPKSIHDTSALADIGKLSSSATTVKVTETPSRSALLNPIIQRAAARYHVDPALIQAIIFAESGYNPSAVSKVGAMGLMQLMPGTAKAMGVQDCFDPEHNIFGGVKYFKKLSNQFNGDVELALAAYNAGSRKVRQFNGIPPYRATRYYIQKVLKYYKIYQGQPAEPIGLS